MVLVLRMLLLCQRVRVAIEGRNITPKSARSRHATLQVGFDYQIPTSTFQQLVPKRPALTKQ
jgi:regulatory protein YycH of two-component signal transduction system YycFG